MNQEVNTKLMQVQVKGECTNVQYGRLERTEFSINNLF